MKTTLLIQCTVYIKENEAIPQSSLWIKRRWFSDMDGALTSDPLENQP